MINSRTAMPKIKYRRELIPKQGYNLAWSYYSITAKPGF